MRKLLLLILLLSLFFVVGCDNNLFREDFDGDGNVIENIINVSTDTTYKLKIDDFFTENEEIKISFVEGTTSKVTIKTDKNILDTLDMNVNDNDIIINGNDRYEYEPSSAEIIFTNVKLEEFDLKGTFTFIGNQDLLEVSSFKLACDGVIGGELNMANIKDINVISRGVVTLDLNNLNTEKINLDIDGVTNINVNGNSNSLDLKGDGVINFNSKSLVANNVTIKINGTVDVKVNAVSNLNIDADCVGSIKYLGNPTVKQDIDGVCSVESLD